MQLFGAEPSQLRKHHSLIIELHLANQKTILGKCKLLMRIMMALWRSVEPSRRIIEPFIKGITEFQPSMIQMPVVRLMKPFCVRKNKCVSLVILRRQLIVIAAMKWSAAVLRLQVIC